MYVFCELCYEQRTSMETEFHITSCCHIFCALCSTPSTKCPICRKTCRVSLINRELAPTIKEYLMNQTEQMAKAGKIYQFQISKMDKFIEANLNVFQEYETNKKKIQKLKHMYEAYKKGIKEEQELIQHLQQKRAIGVAGCADTEHKANLAETPNLIREEFFHNSEIPLSKSHAGNVQSEMYANKTCEDN